MSGAWDDAGGPARRGISHHRVEEGTGALEANARVMRLGVLLLSVLTLAGCIASTSGAPSPSQTPSGAIAPSSSTTRGPAAPIASPSPIVARETTPRPSAEDAPLPTCRAADLSVAVAVAPGRHAAGSTHYPIMFSNKGPGPCSLAGYPAAWFVVAGGRATPTASADGTPADPVVLPPGGAAHATLQISNADLYDPASCQAATAQLLRVLPPGQVGDMLVPLEVDFTPPETKVCLGSGNLAIGAVDPGVGAF